MIRLSRSSQVVAAALVVLLGLSTVAFERAHANSVKLLDSEEVPNLDTLAKRVCQSTDARDGQLSRISTIQKLVNYFAPEIGSDHPLYECKQRHQDALLLLNEVLTTSKANVCSDEKLALIEEYHNQFVSTQLEHVNSRRERNQYTGPHLLNLFFMHYAMEVDALCKRTLINNLEWDLKDKFGDDINERLFRIDDELVDADKSSFGNLFNGVVGKFTDLYAVEKYDDVVCLWDLLKGSVLSQDQMRGEEIKDDFDPITGEPIRLIVKIHSTKYLNKIKQHCHYKLKPIYSKLIMPIIRLSDLGYSNTGEQFKIELDELKSNDNVKRWYATAQLCEAIIPVKFYEDPSLTPSDVAVITKEEAAKLDDEQGENDVAPEALVKLEYEPQTNVMTDVDKLESVETSEAQSLVKKINANIGTRDRVMSRAVAHLFRNIKHKFSQTKMGKFFFARKTTKLSNPKDTEKEEHSVEEDVGKKFVQSIDSISEQDVLKMEGASRRMTKSTENARGIGVRRRHRRKGDVDMIQELRADAISYKRTKSWSEIFAGWGDVLSALAPSRMQLIIAGSILIGLLIFVTMACMVALAAPGMG